MARRFITFMALAVTIGILTATVVETSAQRDDSVQKAFEEQIDSYKIPTFNLRSGEPIFIPVKESNAALHFIFIAVESSMPKELPLSSRITIISRENSGRTAERESKVNFRVGNQSPTGVRVTNVTKAFTVQRITLGYLIAPSRKKKEGVSGSDLMNFMVLVAPAHSNNITNAFIISSDSDAASESDSPIEPVLHLPKNTDKVSGSSFMTSESGKLDSTLRAIPRCVKNQKLCDKHIALLMASPRALDSTTLPPSFKRLITESIQGARKLLESKTKPSRDDLEKLTREFQVIRHWKLYYELNGHLPIREPRADGAIRIAAIITVGPPQPVTTITAVATATSTPRASSTPTSTRTPTPASSNTPTRTPTIRPSSTPTVAPRASLTPTATATPAATATPTKSPTPTPPAVCPEFKEPSASSRNQSISLSNLRSSGALWVHIFELVNTSTLPRVRADEADSFSSTTTKACYIATGGAAFDSNSYAFLQLKLMIPGRFSDDRPLISAISPSGRKRLVCVTLCPTCAPKVMQGFADKFIRGWLL